MNALRTRLAKDERGFTLIELLVVVIIIGILAAIAIPTFLNQRRRGWQAELTSTIRNVALEVEAGATVNGGDYTGLDANVSSLTGYAVEVQGTTNDPVTFTTGTFDNLGFCMGATHADLTDAGQDYDSNNSGLQPYVDTTYASTC